VKRSLRIFACLLSLLIPPLAKAAESGAKNDARFALLIGNGLYSERPGSAQGSSSKLNIGGALPYLPNPCKDVTEIGAALVSKAHWDPKNVVVKCDLDNDNMAAALNQFVSRYQTTVAPTALLYFAGHGAQVGGKAYAFGINAAPDTIGTAEFYKNNTTCHSICDRRTRPSGKCSPPLMWVTSIGSIRSLAYYRY